MNVSKRISPKVLQQIDLKIDDALDNYGDVRAYCGKIDGSMCLPGEDMRYNKSESCNWLMYFLTE